MNPKAVHDKVASLEDRVRQLESERQEMIDALTLAHNHIEFCRDAGMKPSRDVSSQIKTALRNTGGVEKNNGWSITGATSMNLKKKDDMSNQKNDKEKDEVASAVDAIVSLPEGVTDIRLCQWEQQENPFNGTEQKLKWLCELSDTCVLEGDWDMRVTGYGDTQREAFDEALQKWEEAN